MTEESMTKKRTAGIRRRANARIGANGGRTKGARRKTDAGSTQVEFALVIILLMTMVLGIMDLSRALYSYHFVSHAARDATRWAAVNGADCGNDSSCNGQGYMNSGTAKATDIQNYVKSITPLGIDSTQVVTTPSWPGDGTTACPSGSKVPGCPVEVQVQYTLNFMFSLVHKASVTMSSTSQMVISH
jgi:Flp pilus assembly protein TadG